MRLNVECEAFWDRRMYRFAKFMGLPMWQAWGALLNLWHKSQHEMRPSGTREEIIDWMSIDDLDWEEKAFNALLESKLIKPMGACDLFLIVGNEKQIEGLRKIKERAKKGGQATKDKWKKVDDGKSKEQDELNPGQEAPSNPEGYKPALSLAQAGNKPSTSRPNTIQSKTIHYNADNKSLSPQDCTVEDSPLPGAKAPGDRSANQSDLKIPKKWKEQIAGFDIRLADRWMAFAEKQVPSGKFNLLQFQIAICQMRHELKLSEQIIEEAFDWLCTNEFWRNHAITPMEALKRKNGLCRLERIIAQMRNPPGPSNSSRPQNQPLKPPNQRMLEAVKAGEEKVAKWMRGEVEPLRPGENLGVLA